MSGSRFEAVLLDELQALIAPIAVDDLSKVTDAFAFVGWDVNELAGLDVPALIEVCRTIAEVIEGAASDTVSLPDIAIRLLDLRGSLESLGRSLSQWSPPTGLPADAALLLAEDVVHALIDAYLATRLPALRAGLVLAGVLIVEEDGRALYVGTGTSRIVRQARRRPRLKPERLGSFVQDPIGTLTGPSSTGLAASDALADLLLPMLAELLRELGLAADYGGLVAKAGVPADEAERARHFLQISFWAPGEDAAPEDALLLQRLLVGIAPDTQDGGRPMLMLASAGAFSVEAARPGFIAGGSLQGLPKTVRVGRLGIVSSDPNAQPSFRAYVSRPGTSGGPALRIGEDGGLNFTMGSMTLEAEFAPGPPPDLSMRLTLRDLAFGLAAEGRDSFSSELLPGASDSMLGGDLSLGLSLRNGVSLTGRVELARSWDSVLSTPVFSIGPVRAGVRFDQDGFGIRVEGTLDTTLGPLSITVQDIGLRFDLGGNAQSAPGSGLMPSLRLSGPKGVALSFDQGPVKGGGYLFFDPDQAMYAGAVQLSIKALSLSAVGVVTTRLPDGSDGFSMLVMITAEFPPIQLGFGFSLIGIGGLVGIHRGMEQDVLADRLREGRLGSILFPRDVVANVRTIIDDIRAVFPAQRDRYVFGPMVKVGWGANSLLEIDVAVLLSVPAPITIAILGRVRAALPTKDDPVIDLRLEVLGLIDLGRGRLTVEARLVDSRIAMFAVSGGMALLISWGATKAFVLSVGGFNRRFLPPPDFRAPPRLAIALSTGENPTFTLSSYFAITSNAIQFGAAADLHAQADTALGLFSVDAYAQFDVLLIFDPPFFAADLAAGVEIKRNGATLFLARLEASLTGPEPWRVAGVVEFQCIVPLRIPFEAIIGEPAQQAPAAGREFAELQAQLAAEVVRVDNWTALPKAETESVVTLRKVETVPGTVLVHPLGGLGFRQRLLPFEKVIRKFGTSTVTDPAKFVIERLDVGGAAVAKREVGEDFAPGEFDVLTDDEKLSRPAFETMTAGVEALSAGLWLPDTLLAPAPARFDETVINPTGPLPGPRPQSTQPGLGFIQTRPGLQGNAVVLPAAIAVKPETYVFAERDTLTTHPGGEAGHAVLDDRRRQNDGGGANTVLVPAHEAVVVVEA